MIPYRVDFSALPWESPMPGVRHKVLSHGGRRLRLVEYSAEMEPHWCLLGHWGIIMEGHFEIELGHETIVYGPGDGLFLLPGPDHRHRARVLGDKVVAFFVEDD